MGMGLEANFLDPVKFCPWMAQELPGTDGRSEGLGMGRWGRKRVGYRWLLRAALP